jgi:DNA-binding IclR family transcriptional regulator
VEAAKRRPTDGGGIQSVDRAFRVLELVADSDGRLGITDLAKRISVHPATASRLVATMVAHGIVQRNARTEGIEPGPALIRYADASIARLEIVRRSREILRGLATATEETVSLGVPDGRGIRYVDEVSGSPSMVSVSWIGRRTPIHSTSDGKILLAHLQGPQRLALLEEPLEALTPQTVTDLDELMRQADRARGDGYAFAIGEVEVGLNGVAAAVRDIAGTVVATVSVAGPAYRVTRERIQGLGHATVRAAADIQAAMGFRRDEDGSD